MRTITLSDAASEQVWNLCVAKLQQGGNPYDVHACLEALVALTDEWIDREMGRSAALLADL